MSFFTEIILPSKHGKVFRINAENKADLNLITSKLREVDGITKVVYTYQKMPTEFTVYVGKLIEVHYIENIIKGLGFYAVSEGALRVVNLTR